LIRGRAHEALELADAPVVAGEALADRGEVRCEKPFVLDRVDVVLHGGRKRVAVASGP
jgi:hypothetical protein